MWLAVQELHKVKASEYFIMEKLLTVNTSEKGKVNFFKDILLLNKILIFFLLKLSSKRPLLTADGSRYRDPQPDVM